MSQGARQKDGDQLKPITTQQPIRGKIEKRKYDFAIIGYLFFFFYPSWTYFYFEHVKAKSVLDLDLSFDVSADNITQSSSRGMVNICFACIKITALDLSHIFFLF